MKEATAEIIPFNGGQTHTILDQGEFELWKTFKNGIRFKPETPRDKWLEAVKQLCDMFESSTHVRERSQLLLGDSLNFGEERYGEEFAQAIDGVRMAVGLEPKRLNEIMRTTKVIPAARRREGLTIGHYDALRGLEPDAQDEFIAIAAKEHLSVSKLRSAVAEKFPKTKRGKTRAKAKEKDASAAEMKALATELSNWLIVHEDTLSDDWQPRLLQIHKIFRRKWRKG